MVLTEDEAKTKWCPQVRVGESYRAVNMRINYDLITCIASGCMMWRWEAVNTAPGLGVVKPTKGYCGLAGKP